MKRKLIALSLLTCFCLGTTACGNDPVESSEGNVTTTTTIAEASTTTTTIIEAHIHEFSPASCYDPALCDCGAVNGEALGHDYKEGVCSRCGTADPNHKVPVKIEKIGLNETVTITGADESCSGEIEISVLGFEKTTWKADEYRLNADDPDGIDPAFKALGETEEIGMLKLVVKNVSYINTSYSSEDTIDFDNLLITYDEYDIGLGTINTGWDYGSFQVALAGYGELNIGEKVKMAIPYVYDTENSSLRVVLGGKYEVIVPIKQ